MGLLVDGAWQEDISRTTGRPLCPAVVDASAISSPPTAAPGPTGEGGFPAEAGRYHLYVSLACPWAHRTLIFRTLKKLDDVISVSITEPLYGKTGWEFGTARGGTLDSVNGKIDARRNLPARRSALYRPRLGAGTVGQEAAHHRQQRILRNHPHAEFGVRRLHRRAHRLLSGRIARRNRSHQRPRLSECQQRRLSRRLRHQPGRL